MELVNPGALGAPKGYSNGVLVQGGRTLYIAGQVAWNASQQIVDPGLAEQFGRALDNVLAVVEEAGGEARHVASLTIYVKDKGLYLAEQKAVGEQYRRRMGKHFPAMALVEVRDLLEEGALIEIQGVAVLP